MSICLLFTVPEGQGKHSHRANSMFIVSIETMGLESYQPTSHFGAIAAIQT